MTDADDPNSISQTVPATQLAAFALLQLRNRHRRHPVIGDELFADPAWDMLLDLFVASVEDRSPAIKAVVVVAEVAESTALRWVSVLVARGLVQRSPDPADGRRSFVALTTDARTAMTRLLTKWYQETAALFQGSSCL